MRVHGAVRQSKTKDNAVSPEVQRDKISTWAQAHGHEVASFSLDLSRSGGTSAFARPGLGPYLTRPELADSWDVLVATKLDRACRNLQDYLKLREWCQKNGKQLILLNNPDLNTDSPAGKAMGSITATFAEFERDMARERNRETRAALNEADRWPGGRVKYGYKAVRKTGEDGWETVIDEDGTAPVARCMADLAIAGKSHGQIAQWLNGEGHLTSIGREWRPDTVRRVLLNNMDGLLTPERHAKLRAALRTREQNRGERVGGHLLLKVAWCGMDGQPMYGAVRRHRTYDYYRCLKGGHLNIRMGDLESAVEQVLLECAGPVPLKHRELVPGDDHADEIRELESQLERARGIGSDLIDTGPLERKIANLRTMPHKPDRWELISDGVTVAERWAQLDRDGRHSFLLDHGIQCAVKRNQPKGQATPLVTPEGWRETSFSGLQALTYRQIGGLWVYVSLGEIEDYAKAA